MVAIINPFDAGGYSLAEMTEAINILPNIYTRLGQLGFFRFEGVTQRSVIIEQADGVLNLLPTVPRPLSQLVLVATGDVVLAFKDGTAFDALSGQEWVFEVARFVREVEVWKRSARTEDTPNGPPLAARASGGSC